MIVARLEELSFKRANACAFKDPLFLARPPQLPKESGRLTEKYPCEKADGDHKDRRRGVGGDVLQHLQQFDCHGLSFRTTGRTSSVFVALPPCAIVSGITFFIALGRLFVFVFTPTKICHSEKRDNDCEKNKGAVGPG